jgi:ParB family chromosome partitioning protein
MAKRRRLDAPDAAEVARLAQSFAADQPAARALGPSAPPIARVAREVADHAAAEALEARRSAAADAADAGRWRSAQAEGRVALRLPLGTIETEHLARDRLALDDAEMAELRESIRAHGLRMPIEVLTLPAVDASPRYGLISGWRRLQALRLLWAETGDERFGYADALVRAPRDASDAYVAMVEENEVRADLSHYERGRIAVVAAGQGAFGSVEAAVDALFGAGSKAKRSKIRSFAQIHAELGDVLRFGPALSERAGLRLAQALRVAGDDIRDALAAADALSAEDEWSAIEPLIARAEAGRQTKDAAAARKAVKPESRTETYSFGEGVGLTLDRRRDGAVLRFSGAGVSASLVYHLVSEAEKFLSKDR